MIMTLSVKYMPTYLHIDLPTYIYPKYAKFKKRRHESYNLHAYSIYNSAW